MEINFVGSFAITARYSLVNIKALDLIRNLFRYWLCRVKKIAGPEPNASMLTGLS